MISLAGLNSPQRQAAEAVEGPVLILAGAGSGKTRTITYRIAHMVDNLGISGKNILAISFTNKAAKEMRERVITLLGRRKAKGLTMCTFHSLGLRILKNEIQHLGYHKNFTIYDGSDQITIIRQTLKNFRDKKKYDVKTVLGKIGFLKNKGIREDEFANSPYYNPEDPYDFITEHCYKEYQEKLKFFNAVDFDDILFLVVKLFKENLDIAKKYSEVFRYIMIDEYQDTNPLQFAMVEGLTSAHNNLCVVGDDDQSIYAFRGADITNILSFEKRFEGAKQIKLEQNYRSVAPILSLANEVIKVNKNRKEKTMWTSNEMGPKPLLWATGDTDHESAVVVDEIAKKQSDGMHLADVAILVRSATQIPPLEDQLKMSMIPYQIIGGQKLFERKEVKDLIAYLSVINNPNDEISLRRILNTPSRGIGLKTLEKFLDHGQDNNLTLFEAMQSHPEITLQSKPAVAKFFELLKKYKEKFEQNPLPEALATMIEDIGYLEYVQKSYDNVKQVDRRKNDVMNFIETAERFVKFNPGAATLSDFVEKMLLQDSQDKKEDPVDDDEDVRANEVTIMTMHSSKGLEFDCVFLIGLEEETLPHKKTIQLGEDIDEERRLAYVGLTRAREELIMTYCKQRKIYGKDVPRHKSRFLMGLEEYFTEQDRTTFGHMSIEEEQKYKEDFFFGLADSIQD